MSQRRPGARCGRESRRGGGAVTRSASDRRGAGCDGVASPASGASTPTAVASQVSVAAYLRAPSLRRRRRSSSVSTGSILLAPAPATPSASSPLSPSTTESVWPLMRVATAGRAAGRRLGQGHAPALGDRRAGHQPGLAVQGEQLLVGHVAGQADPVGGVEVGDLLLERAAARSRRPRSPAAAPGWCSRTSAMTRISSSKRLGAMSRPTLTTSGVAAPRARRARTGRRCRAAPR